MAITNYQATQILKKNFGIEDVTIPANLYVGLSTTTILANEWANFAGEPVTANGYARVAVPNTPYGQEYWSVTAANSGIIRNANSNGIVFPQSNNTWNTIINVFIADNANRGEGNILYYGSIAGVTVAANTTVTFVPNAFAVQLTNA